MKIKYLAYVALVTELALCATASTAQPAFNTGNGTDNPDWVEEAPPPPPALATEYDVCESEEMFPAVSLHLT